LKERKMISLISPQVIIYVTTILTLVIGIIITYASFTKYNPESMFSKVQDAYSKYIKKKWAKGT